MRTPVAMLMVGLLCAVASCTPGADDDTPLAPSGGSELAARLTRDMRIERVLGHLKAFQRIANANGGTRASGTRGFDESARYVGNQLRHAGYEVSLQEFVFPAFVEDQAPALSLTAPRSRPFRPYRDFASLLYSAGGVASGTVTPIDVNLGGRADPDSGCDAEDFAGFPGGAIALVQRSNCFFRDQATNAANAGASAVVIVQEDQPTRGVVPGTLTPAGSAIPALAVSHDTGVALARGRNAEITIDARTENRTTSNVIAETRAGDKRHVVMVGGHLDSVPTGPGINDNGSGTATILALAEALADEQPDLRVRVAFWGAEEYGLLGSTHYVEGLREAQIEAIRAYLNFDMLGSPNYVRYVYDGDRLGTTDVEGSVLIQKLFQRYFESEGLPTALIDLQGRSDHAGFAASGVAVGGLFSGANDVKTNLQQDRFGGTKGTQHDACYHLSCDTIDNVNRTILAQMADALAYVVGRLADRS